MSNVLIATREPAVFETPGCALDAQLLFASTWHDADQMMAEHEICVLVISEDLPGGSYLELIQKATHNRSYCTSILLLTSTDSALAIDATNAGARYLFTQPATTDDLLAATRKGLESANLEQRRDRLIEATIHDLNNARSTFSFCAAVTEDDDEMNSAANRFQSQLQEAEEKIHDIVSYLTEFIRVRDTKPQIINLAEFLQGIEPLLRTQVDYGVSFELNIKPARIKVDPTQLQRLVYTLLISVRDLAPAADMLELRIVRDAPCELMSARVNVLEFSARINAAHDRVSEPRIKPDTNVDKTPEFTEVSALVDHMGGVFEAVSEHSRGSTLRAYFPALD